MKLKLNKDRLVQRYEICASHLHIHLADGCSPAALLSFPAPLDHHVGKGAVILSGIITEGRRHALCRRNLLAG